MNTDINLDYRPDTYFRPQNLEHYLLSTAKGDVVRKNLHALFDAGALEEAGSMLIAEVTSPANSKLLQSIHPMFMGGNYLPDAEVGEVEIARISINSVTHDVTCVYARTDAGEIHYRVVDEYGGDTLDGPADARTDKPMSLGELADFFLGAWSLFDVLEMNFEGDIERSLDFFYCRVEALSRPRRTVSSARDRALLWGRRGRCRATRPAGLATIRPFGGRKLLFLWEQIERDIHSASTIHAPIPMANGGVAHG